MKRRILAICALVAVLSFGGMLVHGPALHAQSGTVSLGTNGFSCVVTISTATTIQAVGGSCVAPTNTAIRHYITDITFSTNAAGITADSFPTLKTGTGGTCGSNTAVIWTGFTTAATQQTLIQDFTTPIRLPLASEICWIDSTPGSKTIVINGYDGP